MKAGLDFIEERKGEGLERKCGSFWKRSLPDDDAVDTRCLGRGKYDVNTEEEEDDDAGINGLTDEIVLFKSPGSPPDAENDESRGLKTRSVTNVNGEKFADADVVTVVEVVVVVGGVVIVGVEFNSLSFGCVSELAELIASEHEEC